LDGAGKSEPANKGNFPNDAFDKELTNADMFVLRRDDNKDWVSWCVIIGRRNLEDGNEVFIEYGREYWCYRGNINTLSKESRVKCMAFYKIHESDIVDCHVDVLVTGSSSDSTATIIENTKQANKKAASTKK